MSQPVPPGPSRPPRPDLRRLVAALASLLVVAALVPAALGGGAARAAEGDGSWASLARAPSERDEISYVALNGRIHLLGDTKEHHVYDPGSDSWSSRAPLPTALHHVQAVAVGGKIYVIGGLKEWKGPGLRTVYIYDPGPNRWTTGAPMPVGRGAGGVAVRNGQIYYAGGLSDGVASKRFDVYDPQDDEWTRLPDMPRAREHFHAAVVNGRFWAVGGRQFLLSKTVAQTDAYDFDTGRWVTGFAPIPTERGGFGVGVSGDEVIVVGGEGGGDARPEVEAFDTSAGSTGRWRTLTPMRTPRHGIQVAEVNGRFYVAAGATDQGGGHATDVHEVFRLPDAGGGGGGGGGGAPDADGDGVPDTRDRFALDPRNGMSTRAPVRLRWDDATSGGILGSGFTGVMADGSTPYDELFAAGDVSVGEGALEVADVPAGDAWRRLNSQRAGLQLGLRAPRKVFTVHTRVVAPFGGATPSGHASLGVAIGAGTQRAYAKLVVGARGVTFAKELRDRVGIHRSRRVAVPGPRAVDLYLVVRPGRRTVTPMFRVTRADGSRSKMRVVGRAAPVPAAWLSDARAIAVGVIATSRGGDPFDATWDLLRVVKRRPG